MKEDEENQTTFTTHLVPYCYKRIPFALRNAPPTFQQTLGFELSGVWWKTCLIYIDDVDSFSKNNHQWFKDIDEVLALLCQASVILLLPNGHFYQKKLNIVAITSVLVS